MIRRFLKKASRPDLHVRSRFQILNRQKYAWDLKCGPAPALERTLRFEKLFARVIITVIGLIIFSSGWEPAALAETSIKVGAFSESVDGMSLPAEWEPVTFKKIAQHTEYSLALDADIWVVKAQSSASASGLIHRVEIDPRQLPVLRWRWKVSGVLSQGDVSRKSGDDYPARVYVTFAYDASKLKFTDRAKYQAARLVYGEYPPTGTVTYIWANKAAIGTVVPNPFSDRVMMFVLQSGTARRMQWVQEERNVYEDYRLAFGHEPPRISGVALMTDTDGTGESVTAYYGDIIFSSK